MPPESLTIVIATFNRARALARTLNAIARLARPTLPVDVVLVDNASTDDTAAVIADFSRRMPTQSLCEARSGKTHALNLALTDARLGDIIVFTDDDILPKEDWLLEIVGACNRWAEVSVFGGSIAIRWPVENVPRWALRPEYATWAYSHVDFGPTEREWPEDAYPFGPNYWVRKNVFANGRRFDTRLGPRPSRRIMGDETRLLMDLRNEGYQTIYVPTAHLEHCIEERALSLQWMKHRAYAMGRTGVHLSQALGTKPVARSTAWYARRYLALTYHGLLSAFAHLTIRQDLRARRIIDSQWRMGWTRELIALARESGRSTACFPHAASAADGG